MIDPHRSRTGSRSAIRAFLGSEAAGGIVLIGAAALAMLAANSPLADSYRHMLHAPLGPVLSAKLGPMTPHLWINDGLMAVFFLLVGLEIKREWVDGQLRTAAQRRLPMLAAAAGMAAPALIYLVVTAGRPDLSSGWAIPAATDIAFALGVLALLGSRAPTALKLFLTSVAIVDDLGAVAIIAFAYTASLNLVALAGAAVLFGVMMVMNRAGMRSLPLYLIAAALLWYAVLLSGVHATVAGVLAALTIPFDPSPAAPEPLRSPLHRLEHMLARPVAFLIVPLFGFANAGVSLDGLGPAQIFAPLPLGIALGLFVGKQIGIFGAVWLAVRCGLAPRPGGASWAQIYGIALLCGIGFTMSLFIAALAFPGSPEANDAARIGILMGSILSAFVGYAVLRFAPRTRADPIKATGSAGAAKESE